MHFENLKPDKKPNTPNHVNPAPFHSNPTPFHSNHAPHSFNSNPNRSRPNQRTIRPCCLCTYKEYNAIHFTLSKQCGIRIIDTTRTCSTCECIHPIDYQCRTVFPDGKSKICTKGGKHNDCPLHHAASKHSDEAPSCTISVNKFDVDGDAERFIPLVETIKIGSIAIGIQYDTG